MNLIKILLLILLLVSAGFSTHAQVTLITLHSFRGSDGSEPAFESGLVADSRGNLYGTTRYGGRPDLFYFGDYGYGTVFKITRQGVLTTLYSFSFNGEGIIPEGPLVQATDESHRCHR